MASLPTTSCGSIAKYGSSIGEAFVTGVAKFMNDTEQRWRERAPLGVFTLEYRNVGARDVVVFREFFLAYKGRFVDVALTNVFSITDPSVPGQPYNYCVFDQDDFTPEETGPGLYSFTLRIYQARKN